MTLRRRECHRWRSLGAAEAEEGSILPLILVYALLALAVVLVAVDATTLYLTRQRLLVAADGAALAAAEAFVVDGGSAGGPGRGLTLTDSRVHTVAADQLARGADDLDVRLVAASTPDGRSARVRVRTRWRPPLVSVFVPDGVVVEVTSTARGVVG